MKYDTSDPEQVKERKTKAQLKREKEIEELKVLLSQRPFRDWVWKLLEKTRMFKTMSHLDPTQMAIASGHRDVGLWILADILEAVPSALEVMRAEASEP